MHRFEGRQTSTCFAWLKEAVKIVAIVLFIVPSCAAQITNVTNDQSTPIPGAGHDYIKMLSETVNPSNGSVSLRIQTPAPKGRLLTIPFGFDHDTNGIHHLATDPNGSPIWAIDSTPYSRGGWSYLIPLVTYVLGTKVVDSGLGGESSSCSYYSGFVYKDPDGASHALGIAAAQPYTPGACLFPLGGIPNAGDDYYRASTPTGWGTPSATVASADGTVYSFVCTPCSPNDTGDAMATVRIEDRNGNIATSTSNNSSGAYTLTDTLKRPLISTSSFASGTGDTIHLSGLANPYVVTWKTETSNFTIPINYLDGNCPVPANTDRRTVVSSITLPNTQAYTFLYGTDDPSNSNPYGLLSEIIYPSGGWVKYGYGINSQSDAFQTTISSSNGQSPCIFLYGTPVVTKRTVSFDGSHVALQQTFAYSTSWNSTMWTTKTSTVTTNDMVSGQTFVTNYVYSYVSVPDPPYISASGGSQVPVESTITYKDGSGHPLQTVTKTWQDQYLLTQEKITPAGMSSSSIVDYSYGSGGQVTKKTEYDYGQSSPTRVTTLTYETFPSTPIYTQGPSIFDRPCQIVISDGNNNRMAETDFLYDGGTTLCGAPGTSSATSASTPSGTHDETNYGSSSTNPRGNATTKTALCLQSCANAVTTFAYDETGQVLSTVDPCGNSTCSDMTGTTHTTTYSYTDSYSSCGGNAPPSGNTNAYLTQIKNPLGQIETYCYGYNDGQLRGATDPNNQTTTYQYVDSLARLTETDYPPGGGKTLVSYNDAAPTPSVTISREITSGQYVISTSVMNGVGLVTETKFTSDPSGTDYTATTYDGLGQPYTVTNPYRSTSDPTYGLTTYTYDALGRTTQITHPDGSKISTSYTGRAADGTDEGNGTKGVQRISQTDGLGRMVSVCEVSSATQLGSSGTPVACGQDIGATGFLTTYQYDALDNLLQVNQGSLGARTFAYNSLSELTTATHPEAGLTTYTYDADGNLSSRTQPEPNQTDPATTVTTTYLYDALNRMTAKQYSDSTDNVDYNYDETSPWGFALTNTVGRLTTEYDLHTGSVFSYDPMGRILQNHQCTPQNCGTGDFPISYTYDLLGDITSSTDGQLNLFTNTYDAAGQLTSLTSSYADANHPGTLFSSAIYNAPGELTSAHLGNGITETQAYNSRLRMTSLAAGSVYTLNMTSYAPNGDILGVNDSANGTWTYSYDDFNRLIGSSCTSHCPDGQNTQGFSYGYDRYANRWKQTVTAGSGGTSSLSFTGNNNHIDGYSYDAAGNLMYDGSHTYYYDAEHHLVQVDGSAGYCQSGTGTVGGCYIYDAEGRRVRRALTQFGDTDDYLYDLSGHFIAQVSGTGWWVRDEIYAGGKHVATYENDLSTPTTFFGHNDWLGTERVQTGVNGAACETVTSLAFGDGLTTSGSCDPSVLRFTGKQRDWESNLDYFGARYFGSSLGRFMSPDSPSYSNHKDPQSWNLYAYSLNNPVSFRDADGHKIDCANSTQQCQADAAAATANAQAAARVTTQTTTTQHSFLGIFHWTTTETQIAIKGDISSFRALSPNASRLADLVTSKDTVTVSYDQYARASFWANGIKLNGGSTSYTPAEGYAAQAFIDPTRTPGAVYDPDAVAQGIPQANTAEEFGHEVLGHIWGELFGGAPAGTRANMRDSIIGEDAVRALDPTHGQKGIESHHNYNEMPPDPKPQQ